MIRFNDGVQPAISANLHGRIEAGNTKISCCIVHDGGCVDAGMVRRQLKLYVGVWDCGWSPKSHTQKPVTRIR